MNGRLRRAAPTAVIVLLSVVLSAWAGAPSLVWVSTYNSLGVTDDQTRAIAADANGNTYAAGLERRNDLSQGYNAFLHKRDVTGLVVWTTAYNSAASNHDYGHGVALDPSGNVILCGSEDRADLSQLDNAFVRKHDANGLLAWAITYNTGLETERAYAVATDTAGNVLVTGSETKSGEAENLFVTKYSTAGALVWSKSYNSPANNTDIGYGIAVDAAGAVYVAGAENRPDRNQDYDAWIRKYDANGEVKWPVINYSGAPGVPDYAYAVAVDKAGGVYATGAAGAGAVQDLWLRKFNAADGTIAWTTTYNGAANLADEGRGLAVDAAGNVYVIGSESVSAGLNILLRKYDTSGLLVWTTGWDGSSNADDYGHGVAVDAAGNVYAAGRTFTSALGEGSNGWTAKYSQPPPDAFADTGQTEVPVTIEVPGVGTVSVLVPRNDIRVFVESRPDAPAGVVRSDAGQVVVTAVGNLKAGSFAFRVFNRLGELVEERLADKGTRSSWTWRPGDLDAGVYLIQVEGPEVSAIKKVAVGR